MAVLIVLIVIIGLVLGSTQSNPKKGLAGVILGLLYFPLGVIFALTKKYK